MSWNAKRNLFIVYFALLAACTFFAELVHAQASTTNENGDCVIWIDAATGKQIRTYPPGWDSGKTPDDNHWSIGGKTFFRQPDDTWIDAATGKQIRTYPPGWDSGKTPDDNHWSIGGKTFVRVPCPPPAQSSASATPAPSHASAPALSVGNFGFNGAAAGADYSFRSNYSGYGIGGGLLSSPCPGGSQFQFDAAYNHYASDYSYTYAGMTTNYTSNYGIIDVNATYLWNCPDWRYGPAAGFHLSSQSYSDGGPTNSYKLFNVGGFGQFLPQNSLTGPAKDFTGIARAGYAFGDDKGLYAGFDLGYYVCPEFKARAGFNYTGYNNGWKVFSIGGEYQVSQTVPVAISAAYNISSYANGNTISLGAKYNWNIPASTTLEDRDRTGLITGYQVRY